MATAKFNQQELLDEFRLIDPIWAKILERYRFEIFHGKSEYFCKENMCLVDNIGSSEPSIQKHVCLGLPMTCIVGEAYCFETQSYDECDTCYDYSMALGTSGGWINKYKKNKKYYDCREEKPFMTCLAKFIQHFKKKHQDRYNLKVGNPHGT